MNRATTLLLSCAPCLIAAPPVLAGEPAPTPALVEGDFVDPVGFVTSVGNLAINDNGSWIVEADTDNADADADSVLVLDGSLRLREGDPVSVPVGATVGSFDSVNLNNNDFSAWNLFLDNTLGGFDDSAIYADDDLVVQESSPVTAPGFSPGTIYIGFFDVKPNNDDRFISILSVDDPLIPTSVDRALMYYDNPGMGFPQLLVAKEGDVLPDQAEAIADFGTNPHASAFNDADQILVFIDLAGDSTMDGTVYRIDYDSPLSLGPSTTFNKIAQEGEVSPVKRDWSSLGSTKLDLNQHGGWVLSGTLAGDSATNLLIERNGEKFKQEGDTVTTSSGTWNLTSFGSGPIELGCDCRVLWYGDWDDPNTDEDTGLFVNDDLLVQEGVTMIGGVAVDTIRGIQDGYALSENGRYVIAELLLDDGTEGAWVFDVDPCPTDFNGDGVTGFADLTVLLNNWGPCPDPLCSCEGDLDCDNSVGFADLSETLNNWGPCP